MANIQNMLSIKLLENKELKSSAKKKVEKLVYHINRKDQKTINSGFFRDIVEGFDKKYGTNNIMVRAVNNQGMMTFKSFDQDELDFMDFDDYYKNKVHSIKNFDYFYSVEITIMKKL